ncbi:MAG: endopeptidase La [Deltaproteobacteria bacterium]|nr:endopeptidase La [Deltaproteobacteria bacterium]MBW1925064.1 endopeptidase La [Deltaproteobacteria bacterium]MBW1950872.1 endopeptidase La [Deltaproteobacteria bacterium]MBW2009312.1 endopeptidase La [Deltaproteobacteria bacterium]MBW2347455.1 endopeptidase La [Deltaproteobacteria bacterium]
MAKNEKTERLPLLPVRDTVIFPRMVLPLVVRDERSHEMINSALQEDKRIVVALTTDADKGDPANPDVFPVGTVGKIVKLSKGDEETVLVIQGVSRVRILKKVSTEPYATVAVEELEEVQHKGKEVDALVASLRDLFRKLVDLSPHLPPEILQFARNVEEPGPLADMMASTMNLDRMKKQEILECLDTRQRLKKLTVFLTEALDLQQMGKKIQDRVMKGIDKSQREYYLREQLKAIKKELGMDQEGPPEIQELRQRLDEKDLPEHARKAAEKEIERLASMNAMSSEYTVARTYLDWILDLPWHDTTPDDLDLERAQQILDRHHYNLEKIKKRIIEFLAVRKLNPAHKGPILCLVGPPGTGKTSLGRSIAEALGRKFVRMSLGGVKDEAEIRGHRRTYVGALPGRILQGIKKAGSNNPVFVLDEIDKVGTDFRGDPASALLEVLDPEQNFSFSDHYLELEFDLSRVIFIATANQLDPIPAALRDRMEVLELAGYTEDEKINIATRFLVPRQLAEHGLGRRLVSFHKAALRKIIREYTREAGVRNLEREISAVCRGVARQVAEGKNSRFAISRENLRDYLGNPRYLQDPAERVSVPGVATGMAWTPSGGDILFVEATSMPGRNALVLTGQLGDVMKESAQAALSYLRSRAGDLGIPEDFFKDRDVHIHVPAGAIPKDGPSAGITMLTALASLFTSRAVDSRLAMTGEITLRGSVLPVGGIKDKVLAAARSGIRRIILPKGNENDLEDIPEKVKRQVTFHLVRTMDEALELALRPNGAEKRGRKNGPPPRC